MPVSHGIRCAGKGSFVKTTAWGYVSALSAAMLAAGLLLASQSFPGSAAAQTWETVRSSDFEERMGQSSPPTTRSLWNHRRCGRFCGRVFTARLKSILPTSVLHLGLISRTRS